ncbi:MAG TPA: hypothetical protein DIT48_12190 [Actinobacteria bacterium]|nr:hypothetical protein [Actinomycetota bacterium]
METALIGEGTRASIVAVRAWLGRAVRGPRSVCLRGLPGRPVGLRQAVSNGGPGPAALGVFLRVHFDGKCAVVLVNDRGPYKPGRVIDLSQAAGAYLGVGLNQVTADVLVPR